MAFAKCVWLRPHILRGGLPFAHPSSWLTGPSFSEASPSGTAGLQKPGEAPGVALCPRRKAMIAIYLLQNPKGPGVFRMDEP